MKTRCVMVAMVLAASAVGVLAGSSIGPKEQADARKAAYRSQLKSIAQFVDRQSGGKARLLTEKGASASPRAVVPERLSEWGDGPLVTAYVTSAPVDATLPTLGAGRILGAITLVVVSGPATVRNATWGYGGSEARTEGTGSATPGTYMLFQPKGHKEVLLASARVVAQMGVHTSKRSADVYWTEVMRLPLTPVLNCTQLPARAYAQFPDDKHVSAQNPAWRADIDLSFPGEGWSFRLDVTAMEFTQQLPV